MSAGSGPAGKKGQAEAKKEPGEPAAKGKQKREASVQPGEQKLQVSLAMTFELQ